MTLETLYKKAGEYAIASLSIAAVVYYLLSARFVTRKEWDEHIKWAMAKTVLVDAADTSFTYTNRQLLDKFKRMEKDIDEIKPLVEDIHFRMVVVETRTGTPPRRAK